VDDARPIGGPTRHFDLLCALGDVVVDRKSQDDATRTRVMVAPEAESWQV
jgi:hypothetical protein